MAEVRNRATAPQLGGGQVSLEVGDALANFRLTAQLNKPDGGYPLFEAEDVTLRRMVALKLFPKRMARGETSFELGQFINEARSAALLDHPNVVRVYEIEESDGWHFIVMELVRGGNVAELINREGPLPTGMAMRYAAEVADGLEHAHQSGILHRDVKPSNLLLGSGGECKLADFGLSRSIYGGSMHPTLNAEPLGTPLYCAPEVIQGREATPASDIYSLACVVWHMMTGSPPFRGKTVKSVFEQHMNAEPPRLSTIRPDAPDGLEAVLHSALSKVPEERPATSAGFALALRRLMPDLLPGVGPAPVIIRQETKATWREFWWIPVSAAVLAAAVIFPSAIYVNERTQSAAEQMFSRDSVSSFTPTDWSDLPVVANYPARDTASMWRVINADDRRAYGVYGTVSFVGPSRSGRTYRIEFNAAPTPPGFHAVIFPEMVPVIERVLGASLEDAMEGKSILLKGRFGEFRQSPQFIIRSVDQIELLGDHPPSTRPAYEEHSS